MKENSKGILLVIIASILVGVSPIIVKLAYLKSETISIVGIKAISISVLVFLYLLFTRGVFRIEKKLVSKIALVGILAGILGTLLFTYALKSISAINASLLSNLQPIFVIIVAFLLIGRKEKLSRMAYFGIFLMLVSSLAITSGSWNNLLNLNFGTIGNIFVILAVIVWACSDVIVKKYFRNTNSALVVFYTYLIASVFFLIFFFRETFINWNFWAIVLGALHGLQVILYYEGLKIIRVSKASALGLFIPLVSILLSFLVFGEVISGLQIIGTGVLIVGGYFLIRDKN